MGEAVERRKSDKPEELPPPTGWTKRKLLDVINPRGEKVSPADFPDKPFIGMDHVEAHTTKIIGFTPAHEMKSSAARFYKNDVLYGRLRPYLNKVAQPKDDGLASAEFIVFPQNKIIESSFLKYRLNSRDFVSFANHLNEGDRPRVNFEQIGDFQLLLPPFAEQQRIVAKIEELFSELDKGVENLRTAQQQLKVYRQALLKHAFEGKLTADWRAQNPDKLESADALLARIQQEREAHYQQQLQEWEADGKTGSKPKAPKALPPITAEELAELPELPTGWMWSRLGTLVDEPCYGTSKKCSYESGKTGVLRIPNISSGRVNSDDLKFADFDANEIANYCLKDGDILTIRSNGSISLVGQCALVTEKESSFLYAGYLIRLRPNKNLASPGFLLEALGSHTLRKQIEHKAKSTSGVNNINSGEIQSLIIPLCSLSEQSLVTNELAAKLSALDQLEQTITHSLQQADALRQSILKKAFSGQLVPQDPNDEPASVLLERIRAERMAQPKARGRKAKVSA